MGFTLCARSDCSGKRTRVSSFQMNPVLALHIVESESLSRNHTMRLGWLMNDVAPHITRARFPYREVLEFRHPHHYTASIQQRQRLAKNALISSRTIPRIICSKDPPFTGAEA